MAFLSEAQLETALLEQLAGLGFACASDELIGPDGQQPEREAYDEVVLTARLTAAVARLNPTLPPEAQADAICRLTQSELPNLLEENRRIHRLLTEDADVEYYGDDGVLTAGRVRLIDFDSPANNDWLAVQQFTVVAGQAKRRPDVVLFVNGLPLAVIELKAPGGENATLAGAFNQLQTYKQQIPALFRSNAVLALSKAFALAASSDEARGIREEVGFFQAIRAALVKAAGGSGRTRQDRELAIQQIVSRAVVSTEIADILAAAGIQTSDISILSDEFLLEVQQMEKKNLALEALRKLLNDSIRSRTRTNVVETRAFTERLEDAIARYHANAITTAEVLQALIELARDIRAARCRGEEQGLSDDEIAFYDALAENESARQVMGDDKPRVIAHELLVSVRENVAVDWAHRESARARLRVLVKRILRKYGYPPDLQDAAVQTVLQQAEVLSAAGWCRPMALERQRNPLR